MTRIIALTGKMGRGKTEALKYLQTLAPNSTYLKFAGPLYAAQEAVYDSLGMPYEKGKLKDRRLLQVLGTDWAREKDPNFWVNKWKEAVQFTRGLVITDDCRFLNEAQAVQSIGGQVWKIKGEPRGEFISGENHSSEKEIDLITPDVVITNNGTLGEFRTRVRESLEYFMAQDYMPLGIKRGGKL